MKNNAKFIVLLSCMLLGASACDDSYLNKVPLSGPSDLSYFSNQEELVLVVNGLYPAMSFHPSDAMPFTLSIDAISDISWDRNTSGLQALGKGIQDSNNDYVKAMWTQLYKIIARCNFILDNIEKVKSKTTPALYERSIAEARFVRAYSYQNLIELFGGVPLVTKTLTIETGQVPKSTKDEVLNFILDELEAAAQTLPVSYTGADVGRATKGAALSFKARAALYNSKWDVAINAAKAVMDMQLYSLHNSFPQLFSYAGQSSPEIILALQYLRTAKKTHEGCRNRVSRNGLGTSNKVPSQSVVDAFLCTDGLTIDQSPLYNPAKPYLNRDPRLAYTIALPGSIFYNYQFETHKDSLLCYNYNFTPATRVNNQDATNAFATFTGYCWRKYVDLTDKADVGASELNVILIRYAEILLTYAEAKIEKGELDESVYSAINAVRQRPGVNMPAIKTGQSQSALRSVVRRERLYEFADEGLRLFDLRRWKIADKVLNGPLYGRVPRGLLVSAPVIDENGIANYSGVPNRAELRVVDTKTFNAARDYLWPIPNIEIVTNPSLVQNPGY